MYKILNYEELIRNLRRQEPLPPVYQEDFDEGDNYIEFPNIKEKAGEPLEFTVFKDDDNYYISYNNYEALHERGEDKYGDDLKKHFHNYYSYYHQDDTLPDVLKELISEDPDNIFLSSNKENIDKDIKKLTDFLIKEGIVVAGDSLKQATEQ